MLHLSESHPISTSTCGILGTMLVLYGKTLHNLRFQQQLGRRSGRGSEVGEEAEVQARLRGLWKKNPT